MQWELIEPLDEESVYARFLAEKCEGVQDVAVATPNFDETVAQADRGNGVILSGEFGGARVAYLGTDRDLGVIIEIFGGTPGRPPAAGRDPPLTPDVLDVRFSMRAAPPLRARSRSDPQDICFPCKAAISCS